MTKKPLPPPTVPPRPTPEHQTAAARKQREALRATTESASYSNRDRRRKGHR